MTEATWIRADGRNEKVKPKNGTHFTLEELQTYVGGYIERVELQNNEEMWLNEEGKLLGLPINHHATAISGLVPYDVIVGDVLVGDWKLFRDPEEIDECVKEFEDCNPRN